MEELEISKKCPEIYEKLKTIQEPLLWREIYNQLEKLSWLLKPESIEKVLYNTLNIIDDCIPEKFSIIKLDEVKFHINYLVFNLAIDRKNCKKYINEFILLLEALTFFKSDSIIPVEQIEPKFVLLSSLVHSCFMHLELYFIDSTRKSIPQFLSDLFYNTYISSQVYDLSTSPKGMEILTKYPKPRLLYIPYFSKVPNPANNYYGEYKNNKKHGYGLQSSFNGDLYKGEFFEGLMQGDGVYYWNNGGHYEGSFINGQIEGEGVEFYTSGNVYTGEFLNGKKNGKGEMKYNNGDKYIGQ